MDSGLITINKLPPKEPVVAETNYGTRSQNHYSASRDLKNGASGPDVHALQARLIKLGYRGADDGILRIDSDFGDGTEKAVRAFQRAHGIRVDGVVGSNTREALAKAEKMPLLS